VSYVVALLHDIADLAAEQLVIVALDEDGHLRCV
jgi:hypothetical protein